MGYSADILREIGKLMVFSGVETGCYAFIRRRKSDQYEPCYEEKKGDEEKKRQIPCGQRV